MAEECENAKMVPDPILHFVSQEPANILAMRIITGVSAFTLFFAVCSLDTPGAWWAVALAAAVSLAALFVCSVRLGYTTKVQSPMNSNVQSSRSR
jgi:hypothetical protein